LRHSLEVILHVETSPVQECYSLGYVYPRYVSHAAMRLSVIRTTDNHLPSIHYSVPSLPWTVVRGTRAKSNPQFHLIQCETFLSCFSCLIVDREQFPFEYESCLVLVWSEGDVQRNVGRTTRDLSEPNNNILGAHTHVYPILGQKPPDSGRFRPVQRRVKSDADE
jgi:hypothetical protein